MSHMLGVRITGTDRVAFAEKVTPADVRGLAEGTGTLTSLPNERGGIVDDCILTNRGDDLYLVINAGHEDKDLPHLNKYAAAFGDVAVEPQFGQGMLALQGPDAERVLGRLIPDPSEIEPASFPFMSAKRLAVRGVECFVTRSGYTGEDGFEITTPGKHAEHVARALLAEEEVAPIGLGARDSLRLEAGMCLYGNDIDDETTPLEAGLLWTVGKRRREEGGFVGSDVICAQIKNRKTSLTRKRVGLEMVKKGPPPRSHDKIYDPDGRVVGQVTSGVFGPSVKKPVAMGYVEKRVAKSGTELQVEIRGKRRDVAVAKMPFVATGYKTG